MKTKLLVSILFVLIYLSSPLRCLAQSPDQPSPWITDQRPTRIEQDKESRRTAARQFFQDLGITPEQHKALQKSQAGRKELEKKTKALQEERKELGKLLRDRQISESEIRSQFEKIQKLSLEQEQARLEQLLAMRKILSPEQHEKFTQKMMERNAERQGLRPSPSAPSQQREEFSHRPSPQWQRQMPQMPSRQRSQDRPSMGNNHDKNALNKTDREAMRERWLQRNRQ